MRGGTGTSRETRNGVSLVLQVGSIMSDFDLTFSCDSVLAIMNMCVKRSLLILPSTYL